MPATGAWLAVGTLAAGVISIYFIRYLWPYRDNPGARFFIATIGCEALWALSYGGALLVFDPSLRVIFEVPIWIGINFIGVFFLAFALAYTGRGHLVRSKLMGTIGGVQVLHTIVIITNPLHHIAWSNYHIDPIFGAATVSYTHQPWLFVNFVGIYLMVAAGSFLLVDTFFSYGSLYRAQTVAIALSPVLPGLAFVLWLFEVGVSPPLNLTPLTFPVHLGLDMYAFFRRNMFELTPAARRAADRAAIDDLGSAVVILDNEQRIINNNDEAQRLLAAANQDLVGSRLTAVIDGIDLSATEQTVTITRKGERRKYAVSTSALNDPVGNEIGHTLVFQDITEEKQREQRLAVLNRVLRHNLRNDLNVVLGQVEIATGLARSDELRQLLETAENKTEEVIELGEKARMIEQLLDTTSSVTKPVAIHEMLERIRGDLLTTWPDARIEIHVPDSLRFRTDPALLEPVFENLIENAIEHNDAEEPLVEVTAVEPNTPGPSATIEIRDNGPGIPEYERTAIETGEETDLDHGSGIGLWVVKWGVEALGGDIQFTTDDMGTTVRLRLPTRMDTRDQLAGDADPTKPPW